MIEKIELTQEEIEDIALFLAAHRNLWNTCQDTLIDNDEHSLDTMCWSFCVSQAILLEKNDFMLTLNKLADMADRNALRDIMMKIINNLKKLLKQKGDKKND